MGFFVASSRTSVPRIQVLLSQESFDAVRALSEAIGVSMSVVVAQLVDEAAPSFPGLISAFRAVRSRPAAVLDLMAEKMAEAQAGLAQGQLEIAQARSRRRPYKRRAKE